MVPNQFSLKKLKFIPNRFYYLVSDKPDEAQDDLDNQENDVEMKEE